MTEAEIEIILERAREKYPKQSRRSSPTTDRTSSRGYLGVHSHRGVAGLTKTFQAASFLRRSLNNALCGKEERISETPAGLDFLSHTVPG
jgi:hypothetical protein